MGVTPPVEVWLTALVGYRGQLRRPRETRECRRGDRASDRDAGTCGGRASAIVYAKVFEEHTAVADLALIDRTVRTPDARRPDVRPSRERFFRREGGIWALALVELDEVPAMIVTVFSADHQPT
jgi:hypothetical protein